MGVVTKEIVENEGSESQISSDSSEIDQEYRSDRYSFLEVGRILDLT